jgi:hypothetical protein
VGVAIFKFSSFEFSTFNSESEKIKQDRESILLDFWISKSGIKQAKSGIDNDQYQRQKSKLKVDKN